MTPTVKNMLMQPQGIIKPGLVAWYDFQQGADAQVLYDKSGNSYHGQLGSTTGADTNDPTWLAGGGLSFGGDDYVKVAQIPVNPITNGTIIVACYKNANATAEYLFDCRNASELSKAFLYYGTDYKINAYNSGSIFINGTRSAQGSADKWECIALTGTSLPTTTDLITLGSRYTIQTSLNGKIGHFLVYNRVLSDLEIKRNTKYITKELAKRGVVIG